MRRAAILLLAVALLAACRASKGKRETTVDDPELKTPDPVTRVTRVRFDTTAGPFVIEVHPEWAPLGAQRFLELVAEGYYDGSGFFRVRPGFVVQFGLAADPSVTARWVDANLKDDPVKQTNRKGTIAFATSGPDTRTTQVFINLHNNGMLDQRGFAPFGEVIEGMENVLRISHDHGEEPDQAKITEMGNVYLQKYFANLDYIRNARVVYNPPERKLGEPSKKDEGKAGE
jgi:cyclophilin family peptidyl-prolyl cis-trans isomerase